MVVHVQTPLLSLTSLMLTLPLPLLPCYTVSVAGVQSRHSAAHCWLHDGREEEEPRLVLFYSCRPKYCKLRCLQKTNKVLWQHHKFMQTSKNTQKQYIVILFMNKNWTKFSTEKVKFKFKAFLSSPVIILCRFQVCKLSLLIKLQILS